MLRLLAIALLFLVLVPGTTLAEEDHENIPHHVLALFVGRGTESIENREDEHGFAIGLEYVYRFHRHWGVGGVVEILGQDTARNVVVLAPVSFFPHAGWRLVAGPGVEFKPDKNEFAVRLGVGYEFNLGGKWSLAPEFGVDMVDSGHKTWIGGLAVAYEF